MTCIVLIENSVSVCMVHLFHLLPLSQGMHKMYRECHLVHADLSEYNMLWHQDKIYFIDVGQSVEPSHPHGLEFLFRDCTNVTHFFSRSGNMGEVMNAHELFNFVTGLDIHEETDEAFLIQVGMALMNS